MHIRTSLSETDPGIKAWVYVLEGQPLNAPTAQYHGILEHGYETWGLDMRELEKAHRRAQRATQAKKRWSWLPRRPNFGWIFQ